MKMKMMGGFLMTKLMMQVMILIIFHKILGRGLSSQIIMSMITML
uniref:Uncharacterized protein n=1 Tax=Arundo donax TaxID=35708 RepID=A0A0A9EJ80_ARUDO